MVLLSVLGGVSVVLLPALGGASVLCGVTRSCVECTRWYYYLCGVY